MVYPAFVLSEVLDLHSSWTAFATAADSYEANPIGGFVRHKPLAIGVKTALAGGVIYWMERNRRDHPRLMFVAMAGATAMQLAIDYHNYRVGPPRARH
jgi:hypothetical protein